MWKPPAKFVTLILKVGFFVFLALVGLVLFAQALLWIGGSGWYLLASAISVFLAGAVANTLAMRVYERAALADVGFAWNPSGRRNLWLGLGGGIGGAVLVLGPPLLAGGAELASVPTGGENLAFVLVLLLFGAAGEEMLFHGYGFQVVLAAVGPWGTILPVSVVFAWAHSSNLHVAPLALANTAGWGMLLGYAFWRSGDLWLPIGLHAGWNWTLPLFGVNLSGFTMKLTGYAMRWKLPEVWTGGDYGPEGGLLTSIVLVVLFLGLWKAPVRRQQALLLRARGEA
jgi:membrane protease YdiL (CAAX protease family)